MVWTVPFFEIDLGLDEHQAVDKVLSSKWLTTGQANDEFQDNFMTFTGLANAVTVNSCTAALHMALILSDVKLGDEVLLPALNFVAAANMITALGATPVFLDCASLTDLNVPASNYLDRISDKTKAIIILHFAGFPNDVEPLYVACKNLGIKIIEDCAHAPGAYMGDEHVGNRADFACFSFFSNKNLTTGEGGMLCCKLQEDAAKAKYLRSHGMTVNSVDKQKGRATTYDVIAPGFNYRMGELNAAVGISQLKKLAKNNMRRFEITEMYYQMLNMHDVLIPFQKFISKSDSVSAYHIFPILLESEAKRSETIEKLKTKGIATSIHYPSFAGFEAYKNNGSLNDCSIACEISATELTLPLFPTMSNNQVEIVATAFGEIV
jgi:dTDP-4-amino-4,6-dideoxygalactose transaminase